ncbi:acetoin dehydrogenase dihydrolipoyllysine-residue acetyltransferase subunit [Ramlibacter alkalitolerans]|uniref:Acetoin dehydrogenase dihydrolipoyllysine-residue acetyltransferase subunit n=1 Tax=Ramlibacter alkalitolerans TaxID=2039631 RepID=A0ABS1JL42_9BURK|nr:acetoin dehydrogenase dihydrolipoyllysine-residue acetyltransferase subunit [Ramlibacter alkalitolerans]MBL0424914.1 acetoin dehydrogenase dihydrolipoyllysine-residue acetyltransferase subunit [Ramlibacter alkalitolerans]
MAGRITALVMPKWGLEMREGRVAGWLVEEGARLEVGTPVIDVETDKISNAVEAPDPGLLRRKVARDGEMLPVKALLGVLAEADVPDAEVDAFVAAYEVPPADDAGEDEGPAYAWAEVDGIRVRYARRGPPAGVPVLFLHGYGGDLGNWLFNLDAVAAVAPVIALDLPGHGQSDARLPGASLADFAAFVAAFLAKIGVDRVHVVGHSMGGAIGAQLALDHPARVVSLALIDAAGLGAEINGDYTGGFARATSRRELKPVVEQLFADPTLASRRMVEDLLRYKRVDGVGALLDALQGTLFPNGRQADTPGLRLGESDAPLLVVWGAQDRVIPAAHAAQAPRRALVEVLQGAGHMAMMEKPGEVNTLLKRHIGA